MNNEHALNWDISYKCYIGCVDMLKRITRKFYRKYNHLSSFNLISHTENANLLSDEFITVQKYKSNIPVRYFIEQWTFHQFSVFYFQFKWSIDECLKNYIIIRFNFPPIRRLQSQATKVARLYGIFKQIK